MVARLQHSWDRMHDLKTGGFLAHRSPLENEDETEIRAASSVGRTSCEGHPPGNTQVPCGLRQDQDRAGGTSRRIQHC